MVSDFLLLEFEYLLGEFEWSNALGLVGNRDTVTNKRTFSLILI